MAEAKPDAPSVSTPTRKDTTHFEGKWKRPSSASSEKKEYESQHVHWRYSSSSLKNGKWVKNKDDNFPDGYREVSDSATSNVLRIDRDKFYPLKNRLLTAIHFNVSASNNKGSAMPDDFKHLVFSSPKTPKISFEYDSDKGFLKIKVETVKDDVADCYGFTCKVVRQDYGVPNSAYTKKGEVARNEKGSPIDNTDGKLITAESKEFLTSTNKVAYADGAYTIFTCTVTAKGFAGDTTKTSTFKLESPIRTQITSINLTNKDRLDLINNLVSKQFNKGMVQVAYRAADNTDNTSPAFDATYPNEFTLQRIVTTFNVDTPVKAMTQSGWEDVDTNAGATSERAVKSKKETVKRYINWKFTHKDQVQYYSCKEQLANGSVNNVTGIPEWNIPAYSKKKVKVTAGNLKGQTVDRFYDFRKTEKKKIWWYRAYDKKAKKTVRDIRPWDLPDYKKATYTVNGKSVKRYNNFEKQAKHFVNFYSAWDVQSEATKTDIPRWSVKALKAATFERTTYTNPTDGLMGEPIVDVLNAMGFTEGGAVFDKRVWYRIRSERFGNTEYSMPSEAKEFRAKEPTAENDYSGFMRIANNPANPGTSIVGTVGWSNKNNTDEGVDHYGNDAVWTTIVEWSEYNKAPHSNESPSSMSIDWQNSKKQHSKRYKKYQQAVTRGKFGTKLPGQGWNKPIPWQKSADFVIYGLEPGVPVYLWTLRHMVLDQWEEDGPRSSAPTKPAGYFPFTPIDNPSNVQVFMEDTYVVGKNLIISWSEDAIAPQKSWNVYLVPADEKDVKSYKVGRTNVASIPKKLLKGGHGPKAPNKRSITLKYDETIVNLIGDNVNTVKVNGSKKSFGVVENIGIVVGVSTGGQEILSCQDANGKFTQIATAKILYPPTIAFYAEDKYTSCADRVGFLFSNSENFYAVVNLYAVKGITRYLPDGIHTQSPGECVWSERIPSTAFGKPKKMLTEEQLRSINIKTMLESYENVYPFAIPDDIQVMLDTGIYCYEVYAVSTQDESVKSSVISKNVICEYEHQPANPGRNTRIEGYLDRSYLKRVQNGYSYADTVKENRFTVPPTAYIYAAKPPQGSYDPTQDRYRVYRITPDGGDLIADGVPFEYTVVDRYAPFSKFAITRYAIATVTKPGDLSIIEVNYALKRHGMRFDWGKLDDERNVELPFDIELNSSYSKTYRVDSYLDGTVAAHFNKAVTKTETVNTKLVRLQDPVQFELVRELAQYPGTAFFRSHDGSAYECVVEVTGLANNFDSQVSPVAFNLQKVTLSDRFKPQAEDIRL